MRKTLTFQTQMNIRRIRYTSHPRRHRLPGMRLISLVAILVLVAACDHTTAPRVELECLNTVTPPDRYAEPHRYKDSIPLIITKVGDKDYGKTIAWLVLGNDPAQKRCLTLKDSIEFFVGQ